MEQTNLVEGQAVAVFLDAGPAFGLLWARGYEFMRYEDPESTPRPTCLLRVTEGRNIGAHVRYYVDHVRPAKGPKAKGPRG